MSSIKGYKLAMKPARNPVVLGFRVRTGRATALALQGSKEEPTILWRRQVELFDPKVSESREPYHPALDFEGARGEKLVRRAVEAATRVGRRAIGELVSELRAGEWECLRAGLVVGSLIDPARIGNPHVRAHASEGKLFREIIESGLSDCGIASFTVTTDRLYERAGEALRLTESQLREALRAMGLSAGRPWRAEHKEAALAAWISLVS
jgi:hypothetical protein